MNRGLAALGPVLPTGTPVVLPDVQDVGTRVLPTLQLWD
jgi:phage tail protein X